MSLGVRFDCTECTTFNQTTSNFNRLNFWLGLHVSVWKTKHFVSLKEALDELLTSTSKAAFAEVPWRRQPNIHAMYIMAENYVSTREGARIWWLQSLHCHTCRLLRANRHLAYRKRWLRRIIGSLSHQRVPYCPSHLHFQMSLNVLSYTVLTHAP